MIIQHLDKDSEGLEQWDQFLMSSPRGHYCQLSTYLKGFKVYGYDYHVIVARNGGEGEIVAGMGLLTFGKGPMKLVSLPMGPIIDVGHEDLFSLLISEALSYSNSIGAFMFQLSIPFTEDYSDLAILPRIEMPTNISYRVGKPFQVSAVPNQMLWIDYGKTTSAEEWESQILKRFNKSKRRNIRRAERSGLTAHEVTEEAELQKAFAIIERNGRKQGYLTRSWEEFGPTLVEQVRKGQAKVFVACYEGRILGAKYAVLAGQRWSAIMGGTVRTEHDYKVGDFITWQVMKKARSLGLRGFDMTSWGSPSVASFKKGFNPTHIPFVEPYYFVLSRPWFSIFTKIYSVLRKHKKTIARSAKLLTRRSS